MTLHWVHGELREHASLQKLVPEASLLQERNTNGSVLLSEEMKSRSFVAAAENRFNRC